MENKYLSYLPGIGLFIIALVVTFVTYKDYGMTWDELDQRQTGLLSFKYATSGDPELYSYAYRWYGAGFELPLYCFEKWFHLTDYRDIFFMRHLVTHLLFLVSALAVYVLSLKLSKNVIVASVCFIMMLFAPRIYAHSFFNTKDIPFLALFIITLAFSKIAFDKNKPAWYAVLGILAGYTTSIRVMGIMLVGLLLGLLLIDWLKESDKEAKKKSLISLGLYVICFAVTLIGAWPFLWRAPVANFLESYSVMSHYKWDGSVLIRGIYEHTTELPWDYFPTWFVITTPILWTALGVTGFALIIRDFVKRAKVYFTNSPERHNMLTLLCFFIPIFAVVKLNAVIYDDWRHLYFVYPPFVILAGYTISQIINGKFKWVVVSVCALQLGIVAFFMVKNHPFQEVYFNELTSHEDQYLRENYELDYWGASFKQGLEFLAKKQPTDTIRLACNYDDPVRHNTKILPIKDRERFVFTDFQHADYFITNFRGHKEDYPSKDVAYEISVLNSCIMRIYNLKPKPAAGK